MIHAGCSHCNLYPSSKEYSSKSLLDDIVLSEANPDFIDKRADFIFWLCVTRQQGKHQPIVTLKPE